MSDQEEYYEDDYDDFDEEWIWFDEGERDLADELAENTTHAPVYLDDLALDNLDYETDWEYYTDEYYDDDPSVTRKERSGSDDSTRAPGKKRKRGAEDDSLDDTLDTTKKRKHSRTINVDSFPGVVWRTTDPLLPPKGELYEPGNAEKVALLKNWREVFKYSQPSKEGHIALASTTHAPSSSKQKSKRGRPRIANGKGAGDIDWQNDEYGAEDLVTEDELERIYEAIGGQPETMPKREYTPPPSSLLPTSSEIAERPKKKSHAGSTQAPRSGSNLKDVVSVQDIPQEPNKDVPDTHSQNSHPPERPLATQDNSRKEETKITNPQATKRDPPTQLGPGGESSSRTGKRKADTLEGASDPSSKEGNKRARGASKKTKQENNDDTKATTRSQAPSTAGPKRNLRERKK